MVIFPVAPVRLWSFLEHGSTQYIGITIACRAETKDVRLSTEHVKYEWLSREEIPASWPERDELLAVFECVERGAPPIASTSEPQWPDDR